MRDIALPHEFRNGIDDMIKMTETGERTQSSDGIAMVMEHSTRLRRRCLFVLEFSLKGVFGA